MNKMILTAGPSITQKEIDYVTDAVTNGIDEHWGDYINRFEKAFAEYIGVNHAITTSSCTGALHLALVALGIKRGDEVIVPDMSWIATASAVCYTGAKPIFADVQPYTWTLDPLDVRAKITKHTKAIIPVHLYGQPADMTAIMTLANEHGIKVVEDAAPSIGATWIGRRTGSLGHVGCFSFQGAKTLSTGEGGMLVTDDDEVFARVKHFYEHGRTSAGFEISDIGFKYKMSNLQAALGLAQLERVEELVAKKRQIYDWYYNCLSDTEEGIFLNRESTEWCRPAYWMTSIVLDRDFRVCRDVLMQKLKERNIDTRPFFPPISSFPMFRNAHNFTSEFLGANGVNLPSGHRITEDEVKYVCFCLRDILGI